MSDGVSPSPKGEGGETSLSSLIPPLSVCSLFMLYRNAIWRIGRAIMFFYTVQYHNIYNFISNNNNIIHTPYINADVHVTEQLNVQNGSKELATMKDL